MQLTPIPEPTVASFTDAWIETLSISFGDAIEVVASFTDAWIETFFLVLCLGAKVSHLLQMRGLKLYSHRHIAVSHRRIFYRCVD